MVTDITKGQKIAQVVNHILHEDTQVQRNGVDLTAGSVYKCRGPAKLDFGGSEFEASQLTSIDPVKNNESDKYGWWKLTMGAYVIKLNEELSEKADYESLLIAPHEHITQSGCVLSSLANPPSGHPVNLSLFVGDHGIEIKENARIARLISA